MKEKDCKFTRIDVGYCEKCKEEILHEYGKNLVTGEDVKMCIHCDVITVLK